MLPTCQNKLSHMDWNNWFSHGRLAIARCTRQRSSFSSRSKSHRDMRRASRMLPYCRHKKTTRNWFTHNNEPVIFIGSPIYFTRIVTEVCGLSSDGIICLHFINSLHFSLGRWERIYTLYPAVGICIGHFIKRFLSLNLIKTKCVSSKFFIRLKDLLLPLCVEYNIVQMSATTSLGGVHPKCPIFHDSGT